MPAGIVLAGGRSSRMGTPKAWLDWRGSTLLAHTCEVVARGTGGPVVVVRAPGQELPELPGDVRVVQDAREGRGPLQGLLAGLEAVEDELAFAAAVDLPLLHPRFVAAVCAAIGDADAAVPYLDGFNQPLAAAYRTALAPVVAELVEEGRLRPGMLFARARVLRLDEAALLADPALAAVDPRLDSLRNVNTPPEYRDARARSAPPVTVRCYGRLATGVQVGPCTVRAACLRAAAAAVGVALDRTVEAVLDDATGTTRGVADPGLPLVAGDAVAFLPAEERC
jgi:molybdenum cofactor guanylyltransferase